MLILGSNVANQPVTAASQDTMVYREIWGVEGVALGIQSNGKLVAQTNEQITRGIYQFAVVADKGVTGKALEITHLKEDATYTDTDFRFGTQDKTSDTDWTGAEELWFYADLSEYGTQPVKMRLGFQETNDAQPAGEKALRPKPGSLVYYYSQEDPTWRTAEVNGVQTFLDSN